MPFPSVAYTDAPVRESDADAILLIVPTLPEGAPDPDGWDGLGAALAAIGFTGAAGSFQRVHVPGCQVPLAVAGAGADPDDAALRDAAGVGLRQLTGFAHVAVQALGNAPWRPLAEGAALGGYRFADYKKKSAKPRASRVTVVAAAAPSEADVAAVPAIAGAVSLVKDLVTTPAEWLGPSDFADAAVKAVDGLPVAVEVLDEIALRDGGFGGILGVGQGSDRPPRLVRLDYSPENAVRHVALVGKGITFDTGGLSLKPAASMVGMKYDMCGAATVLAVLKAAAEMKLPVQLSAWLCIADNMPSGRATRPGDVLRTLDGTTVEVLNTDAEGRLVLADGLARPAGRSPI